MFWLAVSRSALTRVVQAHGGSEVATVQVDGQVARDGRGRLATMEGERRPQPAERVPLKSVQAVENIGRLDRTGRQALRRILHQDA